MKIYEITYITKTGKQLTHLFIEITPNRYIPVEIFDQDITNINKIIKKQEVKMDVFGRKQYELIYENPIIEQKITTNDIETIDYT